MSNGSLIQVVQGIKANNNGSVLVTVPKHVREKLNLTAGARFTVTLDEQNRIIYEVIPSKTQ